jgi:hypothetical protein
MARTSESVTPSSTGLLVVGRRERVCFPEWGLDRVRAKIDTGAFSSSLDVRRYELFAGEDGPMVRLELLRHRKRPQEIQVVLAPVVGTVSVRNSSGQRESRPLIEPLVRIGPVTRRIRLTVTNRQPMRCPMLLGRQALAGWFLVDVRLKDLL